MQSNEEIPQSLEDSYYRALGKFIDVFAATERTIHVLFHRFTGISRESAMVIKGEMLLKDLIGLSKKLIPTTIQDTKKQTEIELCFNQVAVISTFRNHIVHRGASANEDGTLQISNIANPKSIERFEYYNFNLIDLEHASNDLLRINARLVIVALDTFPGLVGRISGMDLDAPWQYKSPQAEKPYQQNQNKSPKPNRRQKPSPASL